MVGLAQVNPVVGDVDGNAARIRAIRAEATGCDLLVCGELTLAGYPPEDLVLKRLFQERIELVAHQLAADTADAGPALLVGAPWRHEGRLYNAVLLLDGGKIAAVQFKHDLPNYGVFDEKRVFAPGPLPEPVACRGARLRDHGLRGHVDAGCRRSSGALPRRNSSGAQRLAVRSGQARPTATARCRAGG